MEKRELIPLLGGGLCSLVFFAPSEASALTLVQVAGLFYVAVGLLTTFTIGIFVVGVCMWIARFNTWPSYRETAIRVIEWAVTMLFVLILLISLVYFIQRHSAIALSILAFIAVIAVLALIASIASGTRKKKPAGPGGPPRR